MRNRTPEEWAAWEKMIKAKDANWHEFRRKEKAIEDEYGADLAKLKLLKGAEGK